MKKIILIASLLMAGGLWAEQKICLVLPQEGTANIDQIRKQISSCEVGDIIDWHLAGPYRLTLGKNLISSFCHQEKQITVNTELTQGVCTYTGKKLEYR